MNAPLTATSTINVPEAMASCFARQKSSYHAAPEPSYEQRREDLLNLKRLVVENREAILEAINKDYTNRSNFESLFAEYFVVLEEIQSNLKHLKQWMRPQRRKIDMMVYPTSRNRVKPQPLGIIGIIVPWNFPLNLSLCPLAAAFSAGNRAMVKMSENSENLAQLLIALTPKYFSPDKLQFFSDAGGTGPAFSSLPFDHMFFTGSGQTGRAVMASCAKNLTPVTLELGGKSPAIICPDFSVETAVDRILWVKGFNCGQICTNVDYVFLPAGKEEAFIAEAKKVIANRYPDINGKDYTSIIDDRSYQRLQATLDDAVAKGARVINLFEGQTPDRAQRKFPLTLVFNVNDDMDIMQREIFGPLLPVKTYSSREEVAAYVNRGDRPLALYPFSHDCETQDYYITHIMSGGVSVNNTLLHVAQHDMPFGGVGGSGMGHYHGFEGFQTFSKLRPIYYQGPFVAAKMMLPPYNKAGWLNPMKLLNLLIKIKT